MRVRLQRGASSIEIDGEFSEVQQILDRWWVSSAAEEDEPENEVPAAKQSGKGEGKARRRRSAPRAASAVAKDGFDPRDIANKIKEDARFTTFREKIILGDANRTQKAKFVVWFSDSPMSSGQVHKVLQAIDVGIDVSTVSKGLSAARSDFIVTDGTYGSEYRLTARAKEEFEKWLLNGS
ncbi:MAG: hypothetical protein KA105_06730 [Caulobacter sp.]|nr:hypothetical protein [Caulobacter sp.]